MRPTHSQCAVAREQQRADREQDDEHAPARPAPPRAGCADHRRRTMSAGTASTGIPRTTANVSRFAAVRPATARARSTPDCTSIRYWSAAPIAPPPGATLDRALPASCEAITGLQAVDSARRCRAQRQVRAAACRAAIAGEPGRRDLPEVLPRAEDLDHARGDQVEGHAGEGEPEHRAPQAAGAATACSRSPRSISSSTFARSSIARSTRSPTWVIGREPTAAAAAADHPFWVTTS